MAKDSQSLSGIEQAAKNIVALINERPRSPAEAEIASAIEKAVFSLGVRPPEKSSALHQEIRSELRDAAAREAELDAVEEGDHDAYDLIEARLEAAYERVHEITENLRREPQSLADLFLIGEVAYFWWGKNLQGGLDALDPDEEACTDQHWAARLIFAIMSLKGCIHA